ncbi:MAG: sulfotransferase [Bacteroidetes bacterium]|nr:MAG: sulfotransferase [Bacteroidota bacterium]
MVLVGGSGSTGSSLLQNILNRHPDIFAGPETRLFIYPHLFHHWNRYKTRLTGRTLRTIRSHGWSVRGRADLLQPEFGWEAEALERAIRQSDSIAGFAEVFFGKPLRERGARVWVEKTPQNACSFRVFPQYFSGGKMIQTLRNPYDVMASLHARGFNAYEAAGYYIYHTSAAASLHDHPDWYAVHYEDLVTRPAETVEALLGFLGLPFDRVILFPSETEKANPLRLEGWNHSERGPIATSSVGRFQKLPPETQSELLAALNLFKISDKHIRKNKFKFKNFREICTFFGYEYLETDARRHLPRLREMRRKDCWFRTRKLHPTHLFYYPGDLLSP